MTAQGYRNIDGNGDGCHIWTDLLDEDTAYRFAFFKEGEQVMHGDFPTWISVLEAASLSVSRLLRRGGGKAFKEAASWIALKLKEEIDRSEGLLPPREPLPYDDYDDGWPVRLDNDCEED